MRPRFRQMLIPMACALGVIYFAYHGVQGERGLFSWMERSADVERVRAEVETLMSTRHRLEHRVSLLQAESLDLDLLEEQARRLLNLGHPEEIILFDGKGKEFSAAD